MERGKERNESGRVRERRRKERGGKVSKWEGKGWERKTGEGRRVEEMAHLVRRKAVEMRKFDQILKFKRFCTIPSLIRTKCGTEERTCGVYSSSSNFALMLTYTYAL